MTVPFAVFASGSGTNLQALLDREDEGARFRIELLVTDRGCRAEERAREWGRAVARLDMGGEPPADVGPQLLERLRAHRVQGVLLAGFLKLVPATVCEAFRGRILNVHPALLPAFGGKGMYGARVHQAVLKSGAKVSGPTVHYVDERYDEGTVLAQWPVPVLTTDTPDTLAARVLQVEHVLFPESADALARSIESGEGKPVFTWSGCAGTHSNQPLREAIRKAFASHDG